MTYNTSTLMTLCSPDSRSPRFAENQLAARLLNGEESPPPRHFRTTEQTEKQLTAPADRSVGAPASTLAFTTPAPTTAAASRGAGSFDRRPSQRSERPSPSPAAGKRPAPASLATRTRCFADRHTGGVLTDFRMSTHTRRHGMTPKTGYD